MRRGMAMRILVGECKQEVSTFNPAISGTEDFVFSSSDAIAQFHRGLRSEIGGGLTGLTAAGAEIVGGGKGRGVTPGGAPWGRRGGPGKYGPPGAGGAAG